MAISKFNYNSFNVTPVAGTALAFDADADGFSTATSTSMTLISTTTASSNSTISITSGIDNTYPVYLFKLVNMHPATNDVTFGFQTDTGTNTNYNQTMTTTFFQARHGEDGSPAALAYTTNRDIAQGTGFQTLIYDVGNGNDESCSGEFYLFNPSSTTFVKHFMARFINYGQADEAGDCFAAGYVNTTTALTRVQFKMSSGNTDSGTIKLYGLKDS